LICDGKIRLGVVWNDTKAAQRGAGFDAERVKFALGLRADDKHVGAATFFDYEGLDGVVDAG
jgi:hypothetical protein